MTEYKKKGDAYLNMAQLISRTETLRRFFEAWRFDPESETVPCSEAHGRVSAEDVVSRNTLPVYRASGPDGIAVRFDAFASGLPNTSTWKEGVDYAPADCGDDFPDAFDSVIPIEQASFDESGRVTLALDADKPFCGLKQGQGVRGRGTNIQEGETVLKRGRRIGVMDIGLLVTAGVQEVRVMKKPRVGFIPTGNELVAPGSTPARGQNIDSNSSMTAAFLAAHQAHAHCFPIVADIKGALEQGLDAALAQCDIVLLNGGSSMGSEDFVSGLLAKRASFHQHGVLNVPGFPITVALIHDKPVLDLPGPPFGAFCSLDWCVKAILARWYHQPVPQRRRVQARLAAPIRKPTGIGLQQFEMCVRLRITPDMHGGLIAFPMWAESNTVATVMSNALLLIPPDVQEYAEGDAIEAQWLETDDWGVGIPL